MPINSRAKGKKGELELCHTLRDLWNWDCRRTEQFCGDSGDSDVTIRHLPNLFAECKRVQCLNLTEAMELASKQCGPKLPAIFHRRNNKPWLVTARLSDLMELAEMLVQSKCMVTEPDDLKSPGDTT